MNLLGSFFNRNAHADTVSIAVNDLADLRGQLAAIGKSQAVIEFGLDGVVLNVNTNFLNLLGYSLDEVIGKHHSIFVDPIYRQSTEYRIFWDRLGRGDYDAGQYKRIGKNGKEVWIQASYNPILDANNRPFKVVKYATDITNEKLRNADYEGQLAAIGKSQSIIEFDLKGIVLNANSNFLNMLGYSLDEIKGSHHSMFVDPTYRQGLDYKLFWERLARGEYDAGQYKRIGKNGTEKWIQASYNPIFDANNRPFKVVKYASDITEEKIRNAEFSGKLAAIEKSQAVIEFDLNGTVINANANFLSVIGYSLDEIKGLHHSIFVDPVYRQSGEYKLFWERLARGEYDSGQYNRVGKNGKNIWLQASYNPILNVDNKPYKVVKYASDITVQINNAKALEQAVEQVQVVVKAAVNDDLSSRVPIEGKSGMIEVLCNGINSLVDNMEDIVGKIKLAADEIFTGASEIATGNSDLSARTEQQAANLEETASSMEELTSTVKLNADNAKQANVLAEQASTVASDGGSLIQQVVVTMNSINESSQKIADIIGVIDGIAFQTNILALNAAVEAARAGDQGRGFAVVASEVRTLAQRSANAAKDIKGLISDSVKKIENGNALVGKSGDTMKQIVVAIKRVNDIMAEIAAASLEQSAGIQEVSTAVLQMDEMTQQNAALVEEAAAAAESLQSQADQLTQRVAQFRLSETITQVTRKSAPRLSSLKSGTRPTSSNKKLPSPKLQDDEWESF